MQGYVLMQEMIEAAGEEERELAAEMTASFLRETLPQDKFGSPKAGNGMWASLVRVINPNNVSDIPRFDDYLKLFERQYDSNWNQNPTLRASSKQHFTVFAVYGIIFLFMCPAR